MPEKEAIREGQIIECLDRGEDKKKVLNLIRTAKSRGEPLSFAVDGRWGSGKTFFIDLLSKELSEEFFIFKYDSWENDYYEDPLIGMLDSIKDQLNIIQQLDRTIEEGVKEIIGNIVSAFGDFIDNVVASKIGFKPIKTIKKLKKTWNSWAEKAKLPDDFNPYNKVKAAKQLIIASMNELSEIRPILFVVDEIDRCFPTYTLKIIERIHHISQSVSQCITVFSVDTEQLQRIIELVYSKESGNGNGTVEGYLRKVIDFTYDLGPGNLSDSFFDEPEYKEFEEKFSIPIKGIDNTDIREFVKNLFGKMEMRTILKIIRSASYTHDLVFTGETQTKELMCAELMLAWGTIKYKGDIINEFKAELSSPKKRFVKYLKSRPNNQKLFELDPVWNRWFVFVSDLKSLMVYYLYRRDDNYLVRFSPHGGVSNLPPYLDKLIDDYIPCLSKVKC